MILAGDVGGTKVHLALYDFEGGKLKLVRDEKVASTSLRRWMRWWGSFWGMGVGKDNDKCGGLSTAACGLRSR